MKTREKELPLGRWMPLPLWLAITGALLATAGDLGQLWVVNAARPALGLAQPPNELIVWATVAGACGIPLYGFGYWKRARMTVGRPRAAAWTAVAGAVFAVLGGCVHAATGIAISTNQGGITHNLDPLSGILHAGPIVLALWIAAGLTFLVVAVAEWMLSRRWQRLSNPLLLTLVIAATAQVFGSPWRDFIGPASINIAHLIFFVILACRIRNQN